jgi:hypothetical protein
VPVLLDVSSIQPDSILLLDTFFLIVVHAGRGSDCSDCTVYQFTCTHPLQPPRLPHPPSWPGHSVPR